MLAWVLFVVVLWVVFGGVLFALCIARASANEQAHYEQLVRDAETRRKNFINGVRMQK